jgi:hypothetical protein
MATVRRQVRLPASYDEDGYSWALEQAALLRAGRLDQIDVENIAEEIESLGKSFANELRSRYGTLVMHLLEWQFQPEQRSNSWIGTIRRERLAIAKQLRDNPGLKPRREELLADSYDVARQGAVAETDLPDATFPAACPYALDEVMNPEFWPGGADLPERALRRRS